MTFEPCYLVCITTTGEYRVERTQDGGWMAQWVGPRDVISPIASGRPIVNIDARDADGNARDWPSRELTEEACRMHRFLHVPRRRPRLLNQDGKRQADAPQHDSHHLTTELHMSNLYTAIAALGFILCTLTAHAESTPININTTRTVLVESFTVECTYTAEQTVCVEVVTSGIDKGKSRTHVGPASLISQPGK